MGRFKKLLEYGKHGMEKHSGTAIGAAYEMERALKLEAKGEKIIEFGTKLPMRDDRTLRITGIFEVDIITSNKLIECKNYQWAVPSKDDMQSVQCQLSRLQKIARQHGKIFELHSKASYS